MQFIYMQWRWPWRGLVVAHLEEMVAMSDAIILVLPAVCADLWGGWIESKANAI